MSSRIIHTGSVIVDVVLYLDSMPEPGGDVLSKAAAFEAGGALNSIVASTRDGGQVLFCGLAGTGPLGSIVTSALADSGAQVQFDPVPDVDSGFCVALVEASAERTFITQLGAEDLWDVEHARAIPVSSGDLVYVSGYSLASPRGVAAVNTLVEGLPEDALLVVDPSPLVTELDREVFEPVFRRADIISLNGRETRFLGCAESLEKAGRNIQAAYAQARIVARDGAFGSLVIDEASEVTHVPAPSVTPVDTSGAGDTHVGVMMAALSRGDDLVEAVRRASVAAAIQVTRTGPATAPTAAEIDEFKEE